MPTSRLSLPLALSLVSLQPGLTAAEPTAPWEVWHDLHRLAKLHQGDQVRQRSSHCPDGCRFDRHSDGDWRFLRLEGDEGVIFEEAGAGAVTRIWMTQGMGTSDPLTASIRIRFYLDGSTTPAIDLPLPALFDGTTAPFTPPLVGDRLASSGGNFCYVPIPYRNGCKVTLTGAHQERIWFQFSFHRLASPKGIVSFTGAEDLSVWSALLATRGDDPWPVVQTVPPSASTLTGDTVLEPGDTVRVAEMQGPDSITALRLTLPESAWSDVAIRLAFDATTTVEMSLADFFAVGRGGSTSTRSLLLGVDASGVLYCYYPMPFFDLAVFDLALPAAKGATQVALSWELRRWGTTPPPNAGIFGAQLHVDGETEIGVDIPLLEHDGRGRWVGLFADLTGVGTLQRAYLEGDERVFLDGSHHPTVYGTGTEDLFNGGFYFDQGEFLAALHGMPYHFVANGEDTTAAYRLMLTDGPTWINGVRAGLEGGPVGDLSLRARTVAYFYQRTEPDLWPWDRLDLGDPASRQAHRYSANGTVEYLELDGLFEGEPPRSHRAVGAYRPGGSAHFILRRPESSRQLRLRRRLDAAVPWQAAEIWVDDVHVATSPPLGANQDRRWREIDLDLPEVSPAGSPDNLQITVVAMPQPDAPPEDLSFTAFEWQLWADVDPLLFSDGFESGDLGAWTP